MSDKQIPLQIRTDDALAQLIGMVAQLTADLQTHMDSEEREKHEQGKLLQKLCEDVEALASVVPAFPHDSEGNPDFRGHRNDHEIRIASGRERGKLVSVVREQIAKNAVNALMALLIMGFVTWQVQSVDKLHEIQGKPPALTKTQIEMIIQAAKEAK